MSNYTDAWAEQQANPSATVFEIYTIELLHSAIVDGAGNRTSVCIANDVQDHILQKEADALFEPSASRNFVACPFQVPWFSTEDGKVPSLTIRIDNVGRELMPYLDAAVLVDEALTVVFRCHLLDLTSGAITSGMDPVAFDMKSVTVNETYVEGTASPADLPNLQFPTVIYDVGNYPALVQ